MDLSIVFPMFWGREKKEIVKDGDYFYDHPTALDDEGTIPPLFESLRVLKDREFDIIAIAGANHPSMAEAVEKRAGEVLHKYASLASLTNLVGNAFGAMLALQHNLAGDFGGFLNGQDVLRDFLGLKATALSAPLSFMLIQLGLTILAQRPGRSGRVVVGGLACVGLFYTLAQVGEPIGLRLLRPGAFDLAQFIVFLVNVASAIAMLVFGIIAWRKMRVSAPSTG